MPGFGNDWHIPLLCPRKIHALNESLAEILKELDTGKFDTTNTIRNMIKERKQFAEYVRLLNVSDEVSQFQLISKLANIINKVVNSSLKGEDEEYIPYVALHNSNNNGVGNHTEHFSRFFVMVMGLV